MMNNQEIHSYEKVNYILRPRKQIERKIIIEILQELKNNQVNIGKYQYIGMGSIYYYDFILFHKYADFNDFVSIDNKITTKRFKFNKPYDFIKFKNKKSTDYLISRNWNKNSIIWMDYDFELNKTVLEDMRIICDNCKTNDILIFTLDARELDDEGKESFLDLFGNFLETKDKTIENFQPKNFINLLEKTCLSILTEYRQYEPIKFIKLFSFQYSDKADMYTLGGIFSDYNNKPKLENKFAYNKEIIDIDIPLITYKEKLYLDSRISELKKNLGKIQKLLENKNWVKNGDKEKIFVAKKLKLEFELSLQDLRFYTKYYKYYPQYYEGII